MTFTRLRTDWDLFDRLCSEHRFTYQQLHILLAYASDVGAEPQIPDEAAWQRIADSHCLASAMPAPAGPPPTRTTAAGAGIGGAEVAS